MAGTVCVFCIVRKPAIIPAQELVFSSLTCLSMGMSKSGATFSEPTLPTSLLINHEFSHEITKDDYEIKHQNLAYKLTLK